MQQGDAELDEVKSLLTPPARRMVNEMKLQISEITPGSRIGATFVSPVFGIYAMWGEVARASHGDLVIGVYSIESNGKPSSDLVRLDVSGIAVPASGPIDAALNLEHGTTVRATFSNGPTVVHVVGPAVVATRAPMIGVGSWVLAYKGALGVYLQALDVLAAPGALGLSCPRATVSWHDAAAK